MNIVKSTVSAGWDHFKKDIAKSQFVAIDLEMTGISHHSITQSLLDTPEQRYNNMRKIAMKYNIIQVGFCFIELSAPDTYTLRSYNVYTFPKSGVKSAVLELDASAIEFNCKFNMDWNKWIYEGVPYLTKTQENELRATMENLAERDEKTFVPKDYGVNRDNDVKFIARSLAQFNAWYTQAVSQKKSDILSGVKCQIDEDAESKRVSYSYSIPPVNSFLRGALLSAIHCQVYDVDLANVEPESEDAPNSVFLPTKDGFAVKFVFDESDKVVVHLLTEDEMPEFLANRRAARDTQLKNEIGVRNMWKMIQESNINFIGHNCYYDLLFLFNYLEDELPPTFEEFRTQCTSFFPKAYCTKYMYDSIDPSTPGYFETSQTHLGNLYETIRTIIKAKNNHCTDGSEQSTPSPTDLLKEAGVSSDILTIPNINLEYPEGFRDYTDDSAQSRYHEAGYDALCTATVFIYLRKIMGEAAFEKISNKIYQLYLPTAVDMTPGTTHNTFPKLKQYGNVSLFVASNLNTTRPGEIARNLGVQANEVRSVDKNRALIMVDTVKNKNYKAKITTMKEKAGAAGIVIHGYNEYIKLQETTVGTSKSSMLSLFNSSHLISALCGGAITCLGLLILKSKSSSS